MQPQALVVVDVQEGFDDPRWGRRNNPQCERRIEGLVAAWEAAGWPVVVVRHDSAEPDSPLRPDRAGNQLRPFLRGRGDLLVAKSVHSSFHGEPDLAAWLRGQGIGAVAVCGLTTNHCCETTTRVACDLGLQASFIADATATFDRLSLSGRVISAEALTEVTLANLAGEFATVADTATVLAGLPSRPQTSGVRR